MKTILLFFIIVLGLFSCRQNFNDNPHILIPGKGFDNIEIGRTTLPDLIKYFGNNFSVDTFYVHPIIAPSSLDPDTTISKDIYSIRISYDSLGVAFFFKPDKQSIFSILMHSPFKGQTEKGIALNSNTFKDVVTNYGATSWSFSGDNIMKSYNGISFRNKYLEGLIVTDSELTKHLNDKVTEISLDKLKDER